MNNQNKERYKKTFDMIHSDAVINITPERSKKLRIHTITRRLSYAVAGLAAIFCLSNGICLAATGSTWVHKVFSTANGTKVEYDAEDATMSFRIESTDQTYVTTKAGRLYFTLNGQQTDITDKCSTDTYFRYDYTDADHITHVIVIGGTANDYGYAEYLFDADGTYIFNNMNVSSDTPAWFVNAEKDLGVDAESLSDEAATYSVTEE